MISVKIENNNIIASTYIKGYYPKENEKIFSKRKIKSSPQELIEYLLLANKKRIIINSLAVTKIFINVLDKIPTINEIDLNFYEDIDLKTYQDIINIPNISTIYCYCWPKNLYTKKPILLKNPSLYYQNGNLIDVNSDINHSTEKINKKLVYYKTKIIGLKVFRVVIVLIFMLCTILLIVNTKYNYESNENLKDNVKKVNDILDVEVAEDKSTSTELNGVITNDYKNPYYTNYANKYNELVKINSDVVGFISVNNTNINYPVVQSKDNSYYLNHSLDKSSNLFGWLFVDYRNDMNNIDKNTIIYGHTITETNLLFSDLKKTINSDWYNNPENQIIKFSIKENDYQWQIFSIYTTEVTSDYLITEFYSDNQFDRYIRLVKSRSIKDFYTDVNLSDNILTLSTCYGNSDYRLVVHAKLIK